MRWEPLDPDIPDGILVEVEDPPELDADEVARLHALIDDGNQLWAVERERLTQQVDEAWHKRLTDEFGEIS